MDMKFLIYSVNLIFLIHALVHTSFGKVDQEKHDSCSGTNSEGKIDEACGRDARVQNEGLHKYERNQQTKFDDEEETSEEEIIYECDSDDDSCEEDDAEEDDDDDAEIKHDDGKVHTGKRSGKVSKNGKGREKVGKNEKNMKAYQRRTQENNGKGNYKKTKDTKHKDEKKTKDKYGNKDGRKRDTHKDEERENKRKEGKSKEAEKRKTDKSKEAEKRKTDKSKEAEKRKTDKSSEQKRAVDNKHDRGNKDNENRSGKKERRGNGMKNQASQSEDATGNVNNVEDKNSKLLGTKKIENAELETKPETDALAYNTEDDQKDESLSSTDSAHVSSIDESSGKANAVVDEEAGVSKETPEEASDETAEGTQSQGDQPDTLTSNTEPNTIEGHRFAEASSSSNDEKKAGDLRGADVTENSPSEYTKPDSATIKEMLTAAMEFDSTEMLEEHMWVGTPETPTEAEEKTWEGDVSGGREVPPEASGERADTPDVSTGWGLWGVTPEVSTDQIEVNSVPEVVAEYNIKQDPEVKDGKRVNPEVA